MRLELLGLNDYEARAYTALVELGLATAGKISVQSGVPYGRIYDVLESLQNKKLVEVVPAKTKQYKATSPEQLLQLLHSKENELNEIEKELARLKQLYVKTPEPPVVTGTGRKAFTDLGKLQEKEKTFNYTIKYIADPKPEWVRGVKKTTAQGIDNKTLTRYDEETKKNVLFWKKISPQIKKIENEGIAMCIKERSVLIGLIKSNTTLLVRDEPFAKLIKDLFLAKYEKAKEINP